MALSCNGDGSDKLPLWVIGKYKNPRCFKNVNLGNLGCTYQSNQRLWWHKSSSWSGWRHLTFMLPSAKSFWFSTTATHMSPLRNSMPASSWETHVFSTFLPIWRPRSSLVMPTSSAILRPISAIASTVSCCSALRTALTKQKKIHVLQAIQIVVHVWATDVKIATIHNCYRHCQIHTT